MKKNPKPYLRDILESIDKINDYLGNVTKEDFFDNTQLQDSVIRRFEIIGEAVKNIPEDFREKHNEILWKKMTGMRDVLIHDYTGVDLKLVWNTFKNKLPVLRKQIKKLLDEE